MDLTASLNIIGASLKYIAGASIVLTIFALPEIAQKIKLTILKSRGFGVINYLAPTGDMREFVIKFKEGLNQLEPGLTITIPKGLKRVRFRGVPTLNYSYKSHLPIDMETGIPMQITPEANDAYFQQEHTITAAQLKQDEKKKEQMEKLLLYAGPALSGLVLWFVMQQNDKMDKLMMLAGVK